MLSTTSPHSKQKLHRINSKGTFINEPSYQLKWHKLGQFQNISGYTYSGELFAFIGTSTIKSDILRQVAGLEPSLNKSRLNTFVNAMSSTTSDEQTWVRFNNDKLILNMEGPYHNSRTLIELDDFSKMYLNVTVLETLVFSAGLRIKKPSHSAELSALRLLAEIGLKDIESKRIRDLAIWQRRIVFIARELIAEKDVVFIDQPTADLDAPSALSLISSLKLAARGDRIIFITMSNLTFREYAVLDRIQLISTRGYLYFGISSGAISYFAKLGRTPFAGASISDFLIDLVNDDEKRGYSDTNQSLVQAALKLGMDCPIFRSPDQRKDEISHLFGNPSMMGLEPWHDRITTDNINRSKERESMHRLHADSLPIATMDMTSEPISSDSKSFRATNAMLVVTSVQDLEDYGVQGEENERKLHEFEESINEISSEKTSKKKVKKVSYSVDEISMTPTTFHEDHPKPTKAFSAYVDAFGSNPYDSINLKKQKHLNIKGGDPVEVTNNNPLSSSQTMERNTPQGVNYQETPPSLQLKRPIGKSNELSKILIPSSSSFKPSPQPTSSSSPSPSVSHSPSSSGSIKSIMKHRVSPLPTIPDIDPDDQPDSSSSSSNTITTQSKLHTPPSRIPYLSLFHCCGYCNLPCNPYPCIQNLYDSSSDPCFHLTECEFSDLEINEDEICQQPMLLKQFTWCLWRAVVVRYRNADQLRGVFIISSVLTPLGCLLTFYGRLHDNSPEGIYNKILFLTIFPFISTLLCCIWNDSDDKDRLIFSFERSRRYYPMYYFPLASLIADALVFKLIPHLVAGVILYPLVGLQWSWGTFVRFIYILTLLILTATSFEKVVYSSMAAIYPDLVPIKASMVNTLVLSLLVLYSGPFHTLTIPMEGSFKLIVNGISEGMRNVSFFYWGCKLLFYNEFHSKQFMDYAATSKVGVPISASNYLMQTYSIQIDEPFYAFTMLVLEVLIFSVLYTVICVWFHNNERKF